MSGSKEDLIKYRIARAKVSSQKMISKNNNSEFIP